MSYIIACVLPKGGCSKTTVAMALASIARTGGSVVLLDCDPQGSATHWADLAEKSGRFRNLGFPVVPEAVPDARRIMKAARGYDLAIVDGPPGDLGITRAAVDAANYVVVPCPPENAALARIPTVMNFAREYGKPARVVLTQVRAGLPEHDFVIGELYSRDVPVFAAELPLRADVQRAYGNPVTSGVLARFGYDLLTEILKEAHANG